MKAAACTVFILLVLFLPGFPQKTSHTRVIAHRGAWKNTGLPQNSIAALEAAINAGYYASECDIWMTADSVLVVNHDPDFYGMPVETSTYDQLLTKLHPNGEKLSTLEKFVSVIMRQSATRLVLDIKPSKISKERTLHLARLCFEKVSQMNAGMMVDYIFFDYDACLLLRSLDADAEVAYLNGDRSPAEAKQANLSGLDYSYRVFERNPHWVAEAKKAGLTLNVWTVNERPAMERFIKEQFDFITTDEPGLLKSLLKQRR